MSASLTRSTIETRNDPSTQQVRRPTPVRMRRTHPTRRLTKHIVRLPKKVLTLLCAGMVLGATTLSAQMADKVWDFEDGTLNGWTATGTAFQHQPTLGDNVRASRVLPTGSYQIQDATDTQIVNLLQKTKAGIGKIGGNYWDTPYPIGVSGNRWIGTYEARAQTSQAWGSTQGDAPTGTLTSSAFTLMHNHLYARVGGGCNIWNVHLRLEVFTGSAWEKAKDAHGNLVRMTGRCSEIMRRGHFDISHLRFRQVRLVIQDYAALSWGHINVDEIRLTDRALDDAEWLQELPVWGFADTHSHPMNHLGFRAYNTQNTLEVRLLWGNPGGALADYDLANPTKYAQRMAADFPQCNEVHYVGGSGSEGYTLMRKKLLDILEGAGLNGAEYHEESGYPYFAHWPAWHTAVHQQMHVTWIHRAYQSGQRLLVADVGNSEVMGYGVSGSASNMPFTSDYGAAQAQIQAMKNFAAANQSWMGIAETPAQAREIIQAGKLAVVLGLELDFPLDGCRDANDFSQQLPKKCQCAGSQNCDTINAWAQKYGDGGFTPSNDDVIHASHPHGGCSNAQVAARLEELYQAGVRHIIPVHATNNEFGGAALYSEVFGAAQVFMNNACAPFKPKEPIAGSRIDFKLEKFNIPTWYGPAHTPFMHGVGLSDAAEDMYAHVNSRGLTTQGRYLIGEMRRRGMIVDIEHTSQRVKDALLQTGEYASFDTLPAGPSALAATDCPDLSMPGCRAQAYPVLSSHGGPRIVGSADTGTEAGLTTAQIRAIHAQGGLIGIGANPGKRAQYQPSTPQVPATCSGSSRAFAQPYLRTFNLATEAGIPALAIGTDFNGMDYHANPRFGGDACLAGNPEAIRWTEALLQTGRVRYTGNQGAGFANHPPIEPSTIWRMFGNSLFAARKFDVNTEGLAHYGMLPDFLQDLRNVGVTAEQMGGLYRSAERFLQMWEKACSLSDTAVNGFGCP